MRNQPTSLSTTLLWPYVLFLLLSLILLRYFECLDPDTHSEFLHCVFSFKSNSAFVLGQFPQKLEPQAKLVELMLYWKVQSQGSNGQGKRKVKQGAGKQIQSGKFPSASGEIAHCLVTQDIFEEVKGTFESWNNQREEG